MSDDEWAKTIRGQITPPRQNGNGADSAGSEDRIEDAVRAYLDTQTYQLWSTFLLTDEGSHEKAVVWFTRQVHGVLDALK